ncbi:MAG: hypothetical protein ACFFDN_43965 [Candidatus Hodarchaeota archaeon]
MPAPLLGSPRGPPVENLVHYKRARTRVYTTLGYNARHVARCALPFPLVCFQ